MRRHTAAQKDALQQIQSFIDSNKLDVLVLMATHNDPDFSRQLCLYAREPIVSAGAFLHTANHDDVAHHIFAVIEQCWSLSDLNVQSLSVPACPWTCYNQLNTSLSRKYVLPSLVDVLSALK